VAEQYRRELLGAALLTVYGHVERLEAKDTPVVHLIAKRLVDHSALLGDLEVASRDFHWLAAVPVVPVNPTATTSSQHRPSRQRPVQPHRQTQH
jgi:hypothetical protein